MDVLIIGGGASGMFAAITAAQHHRVTLLERQARVGRKLLATGNGRCNLTNLHLSAQHYHGFDVAFCRPAFAALPVDATLSRFSSLGLLTVAEPDGRVYPRSDSANSVLDVLRFALDARGVEVHTGCEVISCSKKGAQFIIRTQSERFCADALIIAAGGLAGGKLGGTAAGYQLLESFGHTRTRLLPSLVQLRTDPTYVRSLKGVRAQCRVTLGATSLDGEVQFTEYGVSGPVIFAISRQAAAAGKHAALALDLLQEVSHETLLALLEQRCRLCPNLPADELLTGMLHNRLGRTVLRYAGISGASPLSALTDASLTAVATACKQFLLPLEGAMGMEQAQVTAGGIRTEEFDPETLESRLVPRLYACGEVLDIDGDCGGYNLQWAWSSGYLAGQLLHREVEA